MCQGALPGFYWAGQKEHNLQGTPRPSGRIPLRSQSIQQSNACQSKANCLTTWLTVKKKSELCIYHSNGLPEKFSNSGSELDSNSTSKGCVNPKQGHLFSGRIRTVSGLIPVSEKSPIKEGFAGEYRMHAHICHTRTIYVGNIYQHCSIRENVGKHSVSVWDQESWGVYRQESEMCATLAVSSAPEGTSIGSWV